MLAQMGWSAGQSLGLTMPGLTENLKVAYKMDNKGIGAQRHEREARANGKDIWVGGGGDLGSLFERLNAANATPSSSSAIASSSSSTSGDGESDDAKIKSKKIKTPKKEKKDKRDKEDRSAKRAKKDKSSSEDKSETVSKKRKHHEAEDASDLKSKKNKKNKEEKSDSKRSKRSLEKQKAGAGATDPKGKPAVKELKEEAVQGRPVRLAHRAKFLRAKRMVSANDLASVNEILGIASSPSSSATGTPNALSGTSTPTLAAPKSYPGPGGSEIPLVDVDRRLEAERNAQPGSDSFDENDKMKKDKKKDKQDKKDKKNTDQAEKKSKKGSKSKKSSSAEGTAGVSVIEQQNIAETAAAAAEAEEKEKSTQIGTNSQGLFVFDYLNRRLMIRKAQIAKQKKAEQEAIFARAARVGA